MGLAFGNVRGLSAIMRLFNKRHTTSIIGSMCTATSVGPLIYIVIYNTFFLGVGSYDGQDIRGYFLFLLVCVGLSHCLGVYTFGLKLMSEVTPEEELIVDTDYSGHTDIDKDLQVYTDLFK